VSTWLVGVGAGNPTLVMFATFVLFLVWTARRLAYYNLEGITYGRHIPLAVFTREHFDVKCTLARTGRWLAGFDLEVTDALVHAHLQNPAVFACLRPDVPEAQVQATNVSRRGVYPAFPYRLESLFPFGLASRAIIGICRTPIVVYPRPRLTPRVQDILQSGMGHGDSRREAGRGSFGEFRSMREHRPGDDARCISWPFSERFQRLIIRETERPAPCRVRVIFHTWRGPGLFVGQKSFERSLQLLSGLFGWFHEQSVTVDFTADFAGWKHVDVGLDSASLQEAVTLLASARVKPQPDVDGLQREVRSSRVLADTVIVVSNTPVRFWAHHIPAVGIPVCCIDNSGGEWGDYDEAKGSA
jgi:uncharacterized protein (DUF58 family)